jgi:aspartoacylase
MLVFGGTHGNEWTGVFTLRNPKVIQAIGAKNLILANDRAFKATRRYVETDLNRAFELLEQKDKQDLWEVKRAHEIVELLNNDPSDWLIDLHTTTANMGMTAIFAHQDPELMKALALLKQKLPYVNCIQSPDPDGKYLMTQKPKGIILELGPVAQGTLHPERLRVMEETLLTLWEIIESGEYQNFTGDFDFYRDESLVPYIKEGDEYASYVHPERQDQDLKSIVKGDPLLMTLDGEVIRYQGEEKRYPIFINEAAYYEKGYAMELTSKQQITL